MDSACVKQKYELRIEALLSSQVLIETAETESAEKENNTPPSVKEQLYGFCADIRGSRACGPKSGKGYTVCEKYLECLNSLPDTPKCEIPVPPGFTEPVWEEVDYMQHLDWAYQIARGKFVGTDPMSFEEWKPLFLNHIADGWLSPQMKKTRVTPLGDKTVTLLAFTEDANGCKRPYEPEKRPKYALWKGFGYLYCILVDDPATPLRMIEGGIYSVSELCQSVLLLYDGKPYFISLFEPYHNASVFIRTFFPSRAFSKPEQNIYFTSQLCAFSLSHVWR